jgi:hypothetical protein
MREDYFMLNPFHRFLIDTKDALVSKIKSFRFPLKGFIILVVVFSLLSIYIYTIIANKFVPPVRAEYNQEGFKTVEQLNVSTLEYQNDKFIMQMDTETTTLIVIDRSSGERWTSNLKPEGGVYPDNYSGLNTETKERQQSTLVVNYAVLYGKIESMNNYKYSIQNQTYRIRTNDEEKSIEVLYKIGDFSIDYNSLPMFMSIERFESIILSGVDKIEDEDVKFDAKISLKLYKRMEEKGMYILTNPSSISSGAIKDLYNVFYGYCGYTEDDLAYDNKQYGVETKEKTKFFEVAVKYSLTDYGFDAKIINESIVENEEYPLVSIDFLPYFSAGSTDDTGYMFIPDGSGSLINYNNGKTYALGYEERYYGDEAIFSSFKMEEEKTNLSLPIYGAKRNNQAYLAIIEDGAEMGKLNADISNKVDSYNVIYPEFYYRESQAVTFSNWANSLDTIQWTKFYSLIDYSVSYHLLSNDKANYNAMADVYSDYLFGDKVKENTGLSFNLTLLGGYTKKAYFLGIPYTKVDSLTNTDQAKEIIEVLNDNGISNINLTYQGWFNDGLKHYNVTKVKFNKVVGNKKDFISLNNYLSDKNIAFYPEVNFNTIYNTKKFNNKDSSKDIFSRTVTKYPYDSALAAQDRSKSPYYYLNPSKYSSYISSFLANYNSTNIKGLGFIDLGTTLSGSYAKNDYNLRSTTIDKAIEVFDKVNSKDFSIMTRNPNDYALTRSSLVLDAPIAGTDYNIIDSFIPFYQLVVSGRVDYSSKSININDEVDYDYQRLKLIETGSDIAMTWSYDKTTELINTDFNMYYSTYYKNWLEKAKSLYQEISDLGIASSYLVNHEYLTSKVVQVTYSNGKKIIINYGTTPYAGVNSMSYKEVI